MSSTVTAYINHETLMLARTSANYDLEEIANKMSIPTEKLESWEKGNSYPTYKQLLNLSNYYKKPSAIFFGKNVPKFPKRNPDFRFLPGSQRKLQLSPKIIFEMDNAESKREIFINLKEDLQEKIPTFQLKAERSETEKKVAERIRKALNVSLTQQRAWKTPEEALTMWISKIEDLEVLIFQFSGIEPKEMRGYAISKEKVPLIGINGKEHPHGKIFTLLHELVHLTLRKGGISNLYGFNIKNDTEKYCNQVAGEILVPEKVLRQEDIVIDNDGNWEDYEIRILSKRFKVSKEVILRKLLNLNMVSKEFYESKRKEYMKYIATLDDRRGGFSKDVPAFKSLKNNGEYYTDVVIKSYKNELITTSKISEFLNVKLKYVPAIEERLYKGGGV